MCDLKKVAQFARDVNGTGGGRVVLEVTDAIVKDGGFEMLVVSDSNVLDYPHLAEITSSYGLGRLLHKISVRTKVGKVFKQFFQMVAFSIWGGVKSRSLSKSGFLVVNHNIEIWGGDILIIHNVFSSEHRQDPRPAWVKAKRWLNPVFTFRIARERIVLASSKQNIVCAVSKATAIEAEPYVNKNKFVCYIENGVDVAKFFPGDREAKDREEEFRLVFVGHEFERKGLKYVIQSLSILPKNVVLYVIGGRASDADFYVKVAVDLGVSSRVFFMGTRKNTDFYYRSSDAFVLPSSYEAWPLVGLEAMACGLPVLMTPVGGVAEFLEDEGNGLFVSREPADIAKQVESLMNNPDFYVRLSRSARETAEKYSWGMISNKYKALFESTYKARLYD